MQSILDKLAEWLKELLISGILGNLSGMFDFYLYFLYIFGSSEAI